MKKINRVKKSYEFDNVLKSGRVVKDKFFVIYYKNNELDRYRFGISVGKKIGNAVCRNKFKRQIRNIVDKNKKYYQNNMDYIIILRKASLEVEFDTLKRSFENLITKINQGDKNEKKS